MIYFIISAVCGIGGGLVSSQVASQYSLGLVGNLFTGFLGGVVAHLITILVLGGSAYSVAAVGGFLGGVVVRVAFTVIRQRMVK